MAGGCPVWRYLGLPANRFATPYPCGSTPNAALSLALMPPAGFASETILEIPGARQTLMFSNRFNRLDLLAALAFAALAAPGSLSAQTPDHPARHVGPVPDQERPQVADHLRQLSGRPSCQRRARRLLGRGVLPLGAAQRSEEQRTARPRLHLLARRWRHRRGRQARRPDPDDRQVQPRRPPRGRRARSEAEEIRRRADQHQPVDPRTDHRPGGDAAVGLGQLRRRRHQDGGRQYRQADRSGMVSDLQGPAFRHDPGTRGQGKGRRHPPRARLQARRFRAAGGRRLCALAVAQQGRRRRPPRSTRRSTRSWRGIRWCRKACATPGPARS